MNPIQFKKEFGLLLNDTTIPSDVSKEEHFSRLLPIDNLARDNMPLKLYRYRICNELNIDSFDKDTIWAVNPSKFNDPHDSLFFADRDYLYKSIYSGFTSEFRVNIWRFFHQYQSLPDIYTRSYGIEFVKQIEKKLAIMTIDEVRDMNIEPPTFEQISSIVDEAQKYMRSNTKIACLSESINNSLMWAHYADYHKGFALEYNFSNNVARCKCDKCDITNHPNCPERKFVKLYPVVYSNRQYDATQFVEWYIAFMNAHFQNIDFKLPKADNLYSEKVYLNKSKIWSYEREWRLICDCGKNVGTDSMMLENNKPTAIYYGAQISPINKKILQKLCENKEIQQYEIYIDTKSDKYKLRARSLNK